MRLPVLLTALMLTALPVAAQETLSDGQTLREGRAIRDGEEWITDVVVTARLPGPALWRVRKGDSQVYVLGAMPVMTKRVSWDSRRVERVIGLSNVLLTAPEAKGGLIGGTRLLMDRRLPLGKKLDEVLPAPLSQRFNALIDAHGLDREKYKKLSPLWAAAALREDVYDKAGIATRDPEKTLLRFAKAQKLKTQPSGNFSVAKTLGRIDDFSQPQQMACVAATLDEIDFALKHARAATEAWAVGDLQTVQRLSPDSALLACLEGAPSTKAMLGKAVEQTVGSITDALQTPGKSLIVLPLSALLAPGGALQQLEQQGATVTTPAL
ncbi:TraB/GumN family protein [Asticcacaulis sp. AND118]|uniref:TraB/GumN family protein n=1 Tax=Asticcacaulis sp. AND118 TaxID=2840468 RepID=UPI001CFF9A23|nr:TraB/GumN family protein [Asticcacaulis sp. AND118]UDF03934.1 TraB/GumN family protein [Asticcacaulis sp. AND118]